MSERHYGREALPQFDLFMRCIPQDRTWAERLAAALAAFGYSVDIGTARSSHFASREAYDAHARAAIVIWSRSAIEDDALIWEMAELVRLDGNGGHDLLYEVAIEPLSFDIKLRWDHNIPAHRSGSRQPYYLGEWSGAHDELSVLVWALPRPTQPAAHPPFELPASQQEALARLREATGSPAPPPQRPWSRYSPREELEAAIAKDDSAAMMQLANMLVRGPERELGLSLLQSAAKLGYPDALWQLGVFTRDPQWFTRGYELGCPKCLRSLAEGQGGEGRRKVREFYERFPLTQHDDWSLLELARELWERDSSQGGRQQAVALIFRAHIEGGSAAADIHIGDLYRYGLGGLPLDPKEGIAWYQVTFQVESSFVHLVALSRLRELGIRPEARAVTLEKAAAIQELDISEFWDLRPKRRRQALPRLFERDPEV
jgi:hypothetical protein